jgi:PAS domain S-box-containing protein
MNVKYRQLARYSLALGAVGAGLLLRLALTRLVGPGLPTFITFYPAVILVAMTTGFGPGFVATLVAALVVDYWIIPPLGLLRYPNLMGGVGLAFFTAMGFVLSLIAGLYRRTRDHLEELVAARTAEMERATEQLRQEIAERKRAGEALHQGQIDLDRAQEVGQIGSWRLDVHRDVLTWSDENHRIFGIPKGTPMTYETFLSTVYPDDREYVDSSWIAGLAGKPYDIEHRIVVDGKTKWVREKAYLEFDNNGGLLGGFGITQDITERKQAEESLRKSKERFELLSETASNLLATDKPQEIVNELCQKVMIHLDCHACFNYLLDEETERLHLNAYAGIPESSANEIEWLDYGVTVNGCAARDACRIVAEDIPNTPDPRTNHVKSFGIKAYACHPLFSAGRVNGTLSFGTRSRMTFNEEELSLMKTIADQVAIAMERINLIEALRRSRDELEIRVEQRTAELGKAYDVLEEQSRVLESFFKDTITPLVFLDRDFNFIRVNEAYARAFHRDESEFPGHNHFEFYPHEENEAIFRQVVDAKTHYQAFAKPFSFPDHPERGVTYWDWTLTPLLDDRGEAEFLVFSLENVTERVVTEKARVQLVQILEATSDLVGMAKLDGQLFYLNQAGRKMLGFGEDEDISKIRIADTHPGWASALVLNEGIPAALQTGLWSAETAFLRRDGTEFLASQVVIAQKGPTGEVEFLSSIARDISELKRSQKATEAERQRFNDVLEMLPAYLILLTPDHHVRFANRFFRERFGESGGRRCFEYLFGRNEPCEVCESYTPLKTQASHNWKWTGPDGRNYDVFDFPLTDTDGSSLILEMGIDVTEQKQAEEALMASSRYVRSLIEASLDPLVTISADGKVTDVNRATELVTGVSREKLIGSDFSMYFTEPEKAREGYETVFSKGSVRDYPLAIRHTSGVFTDVLYNATIYKNEAGEVQGVFAAARDISEQKKTEKALRNAEDRLRQMQKMEALGTLAGGIAHDFNNILMPILINTELALFDVAPESPVANSLQLVLSAANRGKEMVKQITTFSRMRVREHTPVKIATVVKEALTFINSSLPKHIEIRDEIRAESSMVAADPTQIQQILMNLCGNAADAMRENGGVLQVALEEMFVSESMVSMEPGLRVGPYVKLTVSDTGTGISPDVMEKVFDPFFTTKDPAGGTGMGLPMVHGIVKSHGGVVTALSEVGKGSVFTVYLPRVETDSENESSDQSPIPSGKETILVVDDEEFQVQSMKEILGRLGYHVSGKTRSLEALELFRTQPQKFDLVITDEVMPVMTGSKLAQELLKIRSDLPIILCTGYSEAISADKVRKIGIRELMMKPFGVREISAAIRRALKR